MFSVTMLDSLGQSNNHSTFGISDPDSGSLRTDADRRKRSLEQQARGGRKSSVLLHLNRMSQSETQNRSDCCLAGANTEYRALQTLIYSFACCGPV